MGRSSCGNSMFNNKARHQLTSRPWKQAGAKRRTQYFAYHDSPVAWGQEGLSSGWKELLGSSCK